MRDFFFRMTRWLVALAFTAAVLFVIWIFFPRKAFQFDQLDPRLPEAFHFSDSRWVFWGWVVGLVAIAALAGMRLFAVVRASGPVAEPAAEREDPWRRAEPGMGPIVFPPGCEHADPIYVYLSTSEGAVQELFQAAGVVTSGNVILTTEPQRAVLINAASSSLLARSAGAADSSAGLESLCRDLLGRDPEFPWLRGVFVVIPVEELARGDTSMLGWKIHADLQAVRRIMQLHVPVYLVITRLEQIAGFVEFARLRGPHETRQGRWGITLSGGSDEANEAWKKLVDFRFRVRRWTLDLLAKAAMDSDRNARLHGLDRTLAGLIGPITTLVAAAFPSSEKDRCFLRSIDLSATGARPDEQAYLLASVYLPIIADGGATRWTPEAFAVDQAYRRRALRTACVAGVLALLTWLYIEFGLGSIDVWGWLIFGILTAAWFGSLFLMWRQWPDAALDRAA